MCICLFYGLFWSFSNSVFPLPYVSIQCVWMCVHFLVPAFSLLSPPARKTLNIWRGNQVQCDKSLWGETAREREREREGANWGCMCVWLSVRWLQSEGFSVCSCLWGRVNLYQDTAIDTETGRRRPSGVEVKKKCICLWVVFWNRTGNPQRRQHIKWMRASRHENGQTRWKAGDRRVKWKEKRKESRRWAADSQEQLGKMGGMKRREMTPGEPHLPHQLWKKCVCVFVCVCVFGRERERIRKHSYSWKKAQQMHRSCPSNPFRTDTNTLIDLSPAINLFFGKHKYKFSINSYYNLWLSYWYINCLHLFKHYTETQ